MGDQLADESKEDLLRASADIVSAFVQHNQVPPGALPSVIDRVYAALAGLGRGETEAPAPAVRQKPAVSVGRSIQHDYIVCLEDGKRLKM